MGAVWLEGFELVGNLTGIKQIYQEVQGDFSFPAGRISGKSIKGKNDPGDAPTVATFKTPVVSYGSTWTVGFAISDDNQSYFPDVLTFLKDGNKQLFIGSRQTSANGFKIVVKGGDLEALIESQELVLAPGVWHYVECKVTLAAAGVVELRINGVSQGSTTGNYSFFGDGANQFLFNVTSRPGVYGTRIDDCYFFNNNGSTNITFNGPSVVFGLLPSGDGDESDWLPKSGSLGHTQIDDENAADGDDTYVESTTPGDKSTYVFQDLPVSTSSVQAVSCIAIAKTTTIGAASIKYLHRHGGVTRDFSPSPIQLDNYYKGYVQTLDIAPDGTSWTKNKVDAGQFGIEAG